MVAESNTPRSLALLAELEAGREDAIALVVAFRNLARSLRPQRVTGPRRRPVGGLRRDPAGSGSVQTMVDPALVTSDRLAAGAADIARQIADALAAVPDVIAALRLLDTDPVASTVALYVPDRHDLTTVRDFGTGRVETDPWVPVVPWWQLLPDAALRRVQFSDIADVESPGLIGARIEHYSGSVTRSVSSPWWDLIACANTVQLFRSREAGHDLLARTMARKTNVAVADFGRARREIRTIATKYGDAITFSLGPACDVLAARYSDYVQTLTAALESLSSIEGFDMPTLTTQSSVIASLATRIREAIDTGHGGRLVVSDAEQAFSWAPGPAVTLLSYLGTDTVTGRRTTVVTAKDSATPVVPVDEGGAKPMVVDFDSADVNLVKYPGQATLTVESAQFTRNIETAVATVITGQIVRAIEADAATAMLAGAGVVIDDAADITAGVLAAIATIRSNGGAPNVVGLNAADWIAVMTATGAGGYLNFSNPEAGPAGTWLGLAPVIVPGLAAGEAVVADGRAALVQEPAGGPLCIVDPYTQAKNNKVVVTIEAWAVPSVTSPGGVASVAVAPVTP